MRKKNPKVQARCIECKWTGRSWLASIYHSRTSHHAVEFEKKPGWLARRRAAKAAQKSVRRDVSARRPLRSPLQVAGDVAPFVALFVGVVFWEHLVGLFGLMIPVAGGSFLSAYAVVFGIPAAWKAVTR